SGRLHANLYCDLRLNVCPSASPFGSSNGFIIFDYQGPTNFKFAGGYLGGKFWAIGHRDAGGWENDAVVADSSITRGADYSLSLRSEERRVGKGGRVGGWASLS